ncbi:40S ribosomal protein mrp2, mitochondrial [Balamuthia mandrillaris]
MKRLYLFRKHSKQLQDYFKQEIKRLQYKTMVTDEGLPLQVRRLANYKLQNLKSHKYTPPSEIRRRCVITNNARSVSKFFKMHRYQLRLDALYGKLPGVHKGIW